MKEHPIIFSGEMVRAILEGRKTQTRRVIPERLQLCRTPEDEPEIFIDWCPYGHKGDLLWIRESFAYHEPYPTSSYKDQDMKGPEVSSYSIIENRLLLAYWKHRVLFKADHKPNPMEIYHWRPSIHMPKWASRIILKVVNVGLQRIQDISYLSVVEEGTPGMIGGKYQCPKCNGAGHNITWPRGCPHCSGTGLNHIEYFRPLWNEINLKRGYGWTVNPWVWVIEFRRVEDG